MRSTIPAFISLIAAGSIYAQAAEEQIRAALTGRSGRRAATPGTAGAGSREDLFPILPWSGTPNPPIVSLLQATGDHSPSNYFPPQTGQLFPPGVWT